MTFTATKEPPPGRLPELPGRLPSFLADYQSLLADYTFLADYQSLLADPAHLFTQERGSARSGRQQQRAKHSCGNQQPAGADERACSSSRRQKLRGPLAIAACTLSEGADSTERSPASSFAGRECRNIRHCRSTREISYSSAVTSSLHSRSHSYKSTTISP